MDTLIEYTKNVDELWESKLRYSICTLVSRPAEYKEMVESFIQAGFKTDFCEYLYIDNSKKNTYEAFAGLNKFLQEARGKYIILCHQDILLLYDNLEILERRIKEIDQMDSHWGIIANAGAVNIKDIVYKITEPGGMLYTSGTLPAKVKSVDENFILIKRSANLSFSANLKGFHLYGTDLCLIAETIGYSAYVVEFNLLHKSKGNVDQHFRKIESDLKKKYLSAFRGRYIQTTCTKFYISGSAFGAWFFNSRFMMFLSRKYYKKKKQWKERKAS
jgi:hypothetical protein